LRVWRIGEAVSSDAVAAGEEFPFWEDYAASPAESPPAIINRASEVFMKKRRDRCMVMNTLGSMLGR